MQLKNLPSFILGGRPPTDHRTASNVPNPDGSIRMHIAISRTNLCQYAALRDSGMMLAIDKFGHLHGFDTRRQQRLNFVTVGLVDGLGSVRGTPRTGWTPRVGIFENAGYICRSGRPFRRSYVPLYVCTLIRDAAGMVTAIELSCRYPPGTTLA